MISFELQLSRFGENALQNAEKIVKKITLDLHGRIVARTPVDTGRAKANNQVHIGAMSHSIVVRNERTPLGTPAPITQAKAKRELKNFKLGDLIYIYNNVNYIIELEFHAHSRQAPSGMFRLSFAEVVANLNGYGV